MTSSTPPPPAPTPLDDAERRTFAVGIGLALSGLIALAAVWAVDTETAHGVGAMAVTHLLLGRAAGIAFGYAAGFGHAVVISVNVVVEISLVLLTYPLLVAGWSRAAARLKPFRAMMESTTRAAERYHGQIRRYGVIGLIVFVLIPFWMTGPVVAALIGHMLGMRTWVILTAVLPAAGLGVVVWALPLKFFHDQLQTMHRLAPIALVLAIVLVAVAGQMVHRHNRRVRDARRPPAPPQPPANP